MLSIALRDELVHVFPSIPGCMFGGRIGTQARDIGHGVSLLLEKGADRHGAAAVAQGDVSKYFDNLPLLHICISLFERGVDLSLLCSLLRFQVFTCVLVTYNGRHVPLLARCCGGLTGSNVALTMARVPIESSVCDLYEGVR